MAPRLTNALAGTVWFLGCWTTGTILGTVIGTTLVSMEKVKEPPPRLNRHEE